MEYAPELKTVIEKLSREDLELFSIGLFIVLRSTIGEPSLDFDVDPTEAAKVMNKVKRLIINESIKRTNQ